MFTLIPQEIISFTYCIKKDFADAIKHNVCEFRCLVDPHAFTFNEFHFQTASSTNDPF